MEKGLFIAAIAAYLGASAQDADFAIYRPEGDYAEHAVVPSPAIVNDRFADFRLSTLLNEGKQAKKVLGYSKKGRPLDVYYFPGSSNAKALVIGGVHGSELSAVEVAKELIRQLEKGERPHYNTLIIPTLFPDNAATAETCNGNRVQKNAGRYSNPCAIDPNRQMPALGKPFFMNSPVDAYGRDVEGENALLLQLIQAFNPERIVNLHAIKDTAKAGVYADPRTDCEGLALGFSADSALAVSMAFYIEENGGRVPGNRLKLSATALYHLDPKPAAAGEKQTRNLTGANPKGKIPGVSLGGWASTAVCDEKHGFSRAAITMLTVEFPGYERPSEYSTAKDRVRMEGEVDLYAEAVRRFALDLTPTPLQLERDKAYASGR